MSDTITSTTTYTIESCIRAGCGVLFALDNRFIAERKRDHAHWYCPNGHSMFYPAESDIEKANRLARVSEDRRAWEARQRVAAEHSLRATKGALTKIKKRIAAGCCPACHRSFADVRRHMANQHPEYAGGAA